jgi:ferredoxin
MKVRVDLARCEAHGECTYAAPEVFELDDDDQLCVDPPEPGLPRAGRPDATSAPSGGPLRFGRLSVIAYG